MADTPKLNLRLSLAEQLTERVMRVKLRREQDAAHALSQANGPRLSSAELPRDLQPPSSNLNSNTPSHNPESSIPSTSLNSIGAKESPPVDTKIPTNISAKSQNTALSTLPMETASPKPPSRHQSSSLNQSLCSVHSPSLPRSLHSLGESRSTSPLPDITDVTLLSIPSDKRLGFFQPLAEAIKDTRPDILRSIILSLCIQYPEVRASTESLLANDSIHPAITKSFFQSNPYPSTGEKRKREFTSDNEVKKKALIEPAYLDYVCLTSSARFHSQ